MVKRFSVHVLIAQPYLGKQSDSLVFRKNVFLYFFICSLDVFLRVTAVKRD